MAITIARAKQVLHEDYYRVFEGTTEELNEALQLAIEAFTRIEDARHFNGMLDNPLPGESPE